MAADTTQTLSHWKSLQVQTQVPCLQVLSNHFIKADVANFRQMVQQVTGVHFCNAQMSLSLILKPEHQRLGYLPTLDTSAFLLDQHQPSSRAISGSSSVLLQPLDVSFLLKLP
ncbi:hypothetical protein J1N35_041480 [Gossypium stocksii]|uniref:VQ domain-containing protein n=1 Tax=Gossypium stocksii TaxID=47602 RepID=A0A9D3UFK1_9ROSI|nr:hypothetical protein J1N35_041480 [Gossypium stocksii]